MALNSGMARQLVATLTAEQAMDLCLAVMDAKNIDMAHFHLHWRQKKEEKEATAHIQP